ncbi:hypothetical protein Q1695_013209 [Nippostrongylus brasiliensis]|nr:hypothetical protein Q1695_013209 [Nippostrongylus brasiliensis]
MARVMNLVFLLIVIFGTAIAVILTVVLSISNSKSENTDKRPVMFYALYRGNETGLPVKSAAVLLLADEKSRCSLEQNVDNARNSIHSMQDQDIRFSIILYDDSATSTSPLTASEAITKLKEVKTSSSRNVSQTSAIKEFKKQTGTGRSDAFIFFTPCKIHPGDEEDRKNFVHYMEDVQEKTIIVCTAMPAEELKKRYGNTTNVVSEEDKDNIGAKIADFAMSTVDSWTASKQPSVETKRKSSLSTITRAHTSRRRPRKTSKVRVTCSGPPTVFTGSYS